MLEREILQLEVERVEAEAVGDRRVDVERLVRDPPPVRRRHRIERAHVVQPVGELDQDDADVLRHREQHLAEALGLRVLARVELDLVELGDAVDHVGDELAERGLDLRLRDGGVFHHVVQQRGGETLRVEPPLRQDAGDRQRVRDVRLARLAELAAMGGVGELERALDERDIRRRQVIAEMSGELRDFRHASFAAGCGRSRSARCAGLPAAAFSSISMPTLPAAISRSATTVGLSRSVSTSGELPAEICRARLVAASVSSKRLGIFSRQSSIVMRAMESSWRSVNFPASAAGAARGAPSAAARSGAPRARSRTDRRLLLQSPDS